MKIITTLALVITALVLGACANHDNSNMQTRQTTTQSTGYSK